MAITIVRSAYALDVETVRTLERIARDWGVAKSEALRRAIRSTARSLSEAPGAMDALDALHRSLGLEPDEAQAWAEQVSDERRASSSRCEKR